MDRRVPLLALTADVVAVVVFAAVGRASHGEDPSLAGLIGTALPFLVGVGLAWATPIVRGAPSAVRAGVVVTAATVVVGIAIRWLWLGAQPPVFLVVSTVTLALLVVGWRALSLLVARVLVHRVGGARR